MPRRGYRKGISDRNVPVPCFARCRLTTQEHEALLNEATDRAMTLSKLLRQVLVAHLTRQRAELPTRRGPSHQALRDLTRIGNNLNQLARQANTGLVTVSEADLRTALQAVLNAAKRL
ncbi:MAG: hypothetical protein APF80_11990 [Alphaproteobacteria bacterium BRH_c36]|nr:MAG: hypothetical protein APF80_11990 [Alphaproteobacteria bacterium BRH_c36]